MEKQSGLHGRHRDETGKISRKHGNTLVGTLRHHYGKEFAPGFSDQDKLKDVLARFDEPSLSQLLRDHERGALEAKTRAPH
jgi:hypothetical protein